MYSGPGYSRAGAAPRIFGLTLLVLVLAIGGALWFDFLGLIDVTGLLAPALRWVGLAPREGTTDADDPFLLEGARLSKQEEALALREEELNQRDEALLTRESELNQLAEQLAAKEEALVERENSVNDRLRQVENERAAVVKLSTYLTNQPPEDAVAIMVGYSDQLLLSVLLVTDELADQADRQSLVPYWLSLMPADRAAIIGERLALLPELEGAD